MSRRSQRLVTSRYYPGDEDAASSSSLLGGHQTPFSPPPSRTVRRKSSSTKRLSPAPSTQTSYYSESMMSESYLGGSRGLAALGTSGLDDPLDRSIYWGEPFSTRRRRGTGDTESSKINGLLESKTYDTYASSSGYSSEDDYAGRDAVAGPQDVASPLLHPDPHSEPSPVVQGGCVAGSVWHTRSVPSCHPFVEIFHNPTSPGAWYFYPYGLSTHSFPAFPWWGAGRLSSSSSPSFGERDVTALDQVNHPKEEQRLLARFQALEKRFEALEAEVSRWELRRGAAAAGSEPPPGDILGLLEGLLSRREAGMKEQLRGDVAGQLQVRARCHHRGSHPAFCSSLCWQEMEARLLELNSGWQSSVREDLRGGFQQALGELEQEVAGLRRELAGLKADQEAMGKHVEGLLEQLKALRADVEAQMPAWIGQVLSQPRRDGAAALVLQREDLQEELQALENKILAKMQEERRLSAREASAGIGVALRPGGAGGVTEEQVHLIVDQALKRYSEDRVGMVDYALESAGASVINTRCSETYETKTALLSLFGIPLWYQSQSPRVILQPDVNPGNCWAFRGSQGFAVIRLSSPIRPTAVTLEHIPRALSPQGIIPSAPKDFSPHGSEGLLLGRFTYNQDGNPIQTFLLEGDAVGTFQLVELRVLSNWGHPEYTCIYRFRVHGEPGALTPPRTGDVSGCRRSHPLLFFPPHFAFACAAACGGEDFLPAKGVRREHPRAGSLSVHFGHFFGVFLKLVFLPGPGGPPQPHNFVVAHAPFPRLGAILQRASRGLGRDAAPPLCAFQALKDLQTFDSGLAEGSH
uniref:Sad1 and UNC84 domain containing 2 n=1 Tax=Anas platyrhynchos TaxID=8839 RepID=A0A8B9SQX7_ANAPL